MVDETEVKPPVAVDPAALSDPAPEVDLEAQRDERVVPVAQGVLADMASEIASTDVNSDTDFTAILVKILQRTLAADLNLITENPEIFKNILGVYSAFSTVVQKSVHASDEDVRFGKIGREMMALLVKANIPMGMKATPALQAAAAEAIQPDLEAIFARENLTWLEIKYILEGLFRSLKSIEQLFSVNVERSVKHMEAKILGIDDMTDLTMGKLDETLKAEIATKDVLGTE